MSIGYCQSCGAALENEAQFCKNCGTPVAASSANQQQAAYTPPPVQQSSPGYTHYSQTNTPLPGSEPLTVGQYVGMMLLGVIPAVGFILMLIWAFGSETNINKRNYARAVLIMMAIGVVASIFFGIVAAGFMATAFSNFR